MGSPTGWRLAVSQSSWELAPGPDGVARPTAVMVAIRVPPRPYATPTGGDGRGNRARRLPVATSKKSTLPVAPA